MSDLARVLLDEIAGDADALQRLRELVGGEPAAAWVDVKGAAAHLACKPQRIYDLVHTDRIPHHKEGSRLLFRLTELDDWLGNQR